MVSKTPVKPANDNGKEVIIEWPQDLPMLQCEVDHLAAHFAELAGWVANDNEQRHVEEKSK